MNYSIFLILVEFLFVLTDDHRYLIQNFGTYPPPRNLYIWKPDTGECIYKGFYFKSKVIGNTVEVAYEHSSYFHDQWVKREHIINEEVNLFGNECIQNKTYLNANSLEEINLLHQEDSLIIIAELNMDTGEEHLLRGEIVQNLQ